MGMRKGSNTRAAASEIRAALSGPPLADSAAAAALAEELALEFDLFFE
ncbi:MAG: hypothetical protein ACJATT_003526 [Myxococcota bacterium]|jgi:hypothetical protein